LKRGYCIRKNGGKKAPFLKRGFSQNDGSFEIFVRGETQDVFAAADKAAVHEHLRKMRVVGELTDAVEQIGIGTNVNAFVFDSGLFQFFGRFGRKTAPRMGGRAFHEQDDVMPVHFALNALKRFVFSHGCNPFERMNQPCAADRRDFRPSWTFFFFLSLINANQYIPFCP